MSQQYRSAAFTAFLLSGAEDTTFDAYLESLGLGRTSSSKPKKEVVKAEEAIAKAHDILAKFQSKT